MEPLGFWSLGCGGGGALPPLLVFSPPAGFLGWPGLLPFRRGWAWWDDGHTMRGEREGQEAQPSNTQTYQNQATEQITGQENSTCTKEMKRKKKSILIKG
jgi:hypothetical protein